MGEIAEWRARCGINVRLVNVETSEIMAALTGKGAKSQTNIKLSEKWGDLSGFSFGSSRFAEHILGKATTSAVKGVAEEIEEKTVGLVPVVITPEVTPTVTPEVEPEVIEGLVAKVSDDEVVINVGSQKGVKVDDIFSVRRITETITDPETGEVILETKDKPLAKSRFWEGEKRLRLVIWSIYKSKSEEKGGEESFIQRLKIINAPNKHSLATRKGGSE